MKKTEHIEELLSHFAEDELDSCERTEVDAFLKAHPEEESELQFERTVMSKLRALPHEEVPGEFSLQILAAAPSLPGGFLHRVELSLRRLLLPGLVTAGAFAACLLLIPTSPDLFSGTPGASPATSYQARSIQVASLVAGAGGLTLDGEILAPGSRHSVFQGQRLLVPSDSSAQLHIGDGVDVEVLPGSEVSLDSRIVFLKEGKVHAKVRPGIGNFVVHAPQASAWVVGTEFEVSAQGDKTQVQVQKGIVEVRTRSRGASTQLLAGGSAQVAASNPTHLEIQGAHREAQNPLQVASPSDGGPVEATVGISGAQASNPEGLPDLDSN